MFLGSALAASLLSAVTSGLLLITPSSWLGLPPLVSLGHAIPYGIIAALPVGVFLVLVRRVHPAAASPISGTLGGVAGFLLGFVALSNLGMLVGPPLFVLTSLLLARALVRPSSPPMGWWPMVGVALFYAVFVLVGAWVYVDARFFNHEGIVVGPRLALLGLGLMAIVFAAHLAGGRALL